MTKGVELKSCPADRSKPAGLDHVGFGGYVTELGFWLKQNRPPVNTPNARHARPLPSRLSAAQTPRLEHGPAFYPGPAQAVDVCKTTQPPQILTRGYEGILRR